MNPIKITSNRKYYRNRLQLLLNYLNLHGKSVLDLGCGEMLLYQLIKENITAYKGIDKQSWSNADHFMQADIMDFSNWKDFIADFIFLLGVLDHIAFSDKSDLLKQCIGKFRNALVISQRNPESFINYFIPAVSAVIDIEKSFRRFKIQKLHFLKIPGSDCVYDLSTKPEFIKKQATEIIYLISS